MTSKKSSTGGHISDLPTKDEQIRLRETRNLMSTGLLQLQIEEMLREVNDNHSSSMRKHDSNMRKWLENFTDTMKSMTTNGIMITPSWLIEQGITCLEFRDVQSSITFRKPTNITVVGSYSHHLSTHPFLNVDVVIELPHGTLSGRYVANLL